MARITHVKKAQQRYAMVPVLNEDGTPKKTLIINSRTGEPKLTKSGAKMYMPVKVRDLSKPLPNNTCEHCRKEIEPGQPYKHVSPKSGPYGGRTRYRCESCPTWQYWDLSNSLSARIAQIQEEAGPFDVTDDTDNSEVEEHLSGVAERIRELASEKQEAAENMESGFGHSTSQSEELQEQADQLEGWADDVENANLPDKPEAPDFSGVYEDEAQDLEDTYRQELDQWASEIESAIEDAIQNSPF